MAPTGKLGPPVSEDVAHKGGAGMSFALYFFYFFYSPHFLRHKHATRTLRHMPTACKCLSSHPIYTNKAVKVLHSPILVHHPFTLFLMFTALPSLQMRIGHAKTHY